MPICITALPYFSLDVNQNDKVQLLEAEFGLKGFALYIHLLQQIYGGKGYYTLWNKDVELLFAKKNNVGRGFVSEIVQSCLRRGIFDNDLYSQYGVLTSKEIQDSYFYACKRRKGVKVISEILLSDPYVHINDDNIIRENVDIIAENVNTKGQRKENKSKENIYSSCSNTRAREEFFEDEGNVQNYVENSEKDDAEALSVLNMLSSEAVTILCRNCDMFISKYWCRPLNKYDYEQAAESLFILFVKKKAVFKELNEDHMQLLQEAIQIAAAADAKKWSYVKGIFRKWGNANVFTYSDFVAFDARIGVK